MAKDISSNDALFSILVTTRLSHKMHAGILPMFDYLLCIFGLVLSSILYPRSLPLCTMSLHDVSNYGSQQLPICHSSKQCLPLTISPNSCSAINLNKFIRQVTCFLHVLVYPMSYHKLKTKNFQFDKSRRMSTNT